MKKFFKRGGLIFGLGFVIAQCFGPEKNKAEELYLDAFIEDTKPSAAVINILETACTDCHSNNTRYPWYNQITPVNYWLADHVNHGKTHLNLSKWIAYSTKQKRHKLQEIVEEIEGKHMPLPSYTWIHKDAQLTKSQIQAVKEWVDVTQVKYAFSKAAE